MRTAVLASILALAASWPSSAQDNSRHLDVAPGVVVKTLAQNWSDGEANEFYHQPQGSRLIPYDWFLHLEQPGSDKPFRAADNIRKFGYIPRLADPKNPDGLPIGFAPDAPYDDGVKGLGMTCAACHTGRVERRGTTFLIDGAPAMADFESFMKELVAALNATAADDSKFDRFAAAVLRQGATAERKADLRASLRAVVATRADYNRRNLPVAPEGRFGHGRVDAFGAIFNEVSTTFLGMPGNAKPADAPVSYPCLWDAPQHERVQWNGAAENRSSVIGNTLFGAAEVGALGRNTGEVLGVFGAAEVNEIELLLPRRYRSTVNKPNLLKIENSLKTLWSPEWPQDVLGAIDEARRAKGETVFKTSCATCHAAIDRKAPGRRVAFKSADVGTDQTVNRNFLRLADTGRLRNRKKTLLGRERFGAQEPVGAILKHVVERSILDPNLNGPAIVAALEKAGLDAAKAAIGRSHLIDSLNPGFRLTGTIDSPERRYSGNFDSLRSEGRSLVVGGGHFLVKEKNPAAGAGAEEVLDLREADADQAARANSRGLVARGVGPGAESPATATIATATVKLDYKSRPLNGVWATAPYLHNGSVRTLADLLKPAAQRAKTFHVGSREFDPECVGFQDDPAFPVFDTTLPGNSNAGHEFGAALAEEERRDLLEYLKSL